MSFLTITTDQLELFLKELQQPVFWPQSLQIIKHVENHLQKNQYAWPGMRFVVDTFPNFNACVMGPDGLNQNDVPRRNYWTYSAVARNLDAFRQLLEKEGVLQWTNAFYFSAFPSRLYRTLEDVCKMHGTTIGPDERSDFSSTGLLIDTTRSHPGEPNLEGLCLKPLAAADIAKANQMWPYGRSASSSTYLTYLHSHGFPTMAAYTAADDELIAFLICNADMNLAGAYVAPEYRNRKIFQAMAHNWCQEMAAIGQTLTFALVTEANVASIKSLQNLGAEKRDDWPVSYVLFIPPNSDPFDPLLLWYSELNKK